MSAGWTKTDLKGSLVADEWCLLTEGIVSTRSTSVGFLAVTVTGCSIDVAVDAVWAWLLAWVSNLPRTSCDSCLPMLLSKASGVKFVLPLTWSELPALKEPLWADAGPFVLVVEFCLFRGVGSSW